MVLERKTMLVTDITSKQELDEMKSIMEIFFVTGRVKELTPS